jgi:hypothetical protein
VHHHDLSQPPNCSVCVPRLNTRSAAQESTHRACATALHVANGPYSGATATTAFTATRTSIRPRTLSGCWMRSTATPPPSSGAEQPLRPGPSTLTNPAPAGWLEELRFPNPRLPMPPGWPGPWAEKSPDETRLIGWDIWAAPSASRVEFLLGDAPQQCRLRSPTGICAGGDRALLRADSTTPAASTEHRNDRRVCVSAEQGRGRQVPCQPDIARLVHSVAPDVRCAHGRAIIGLRHG